MRQVHFVGVEDMALEAPPDLRDGEIVEAIRVGGPRDGRSMGIFQVEHEPGGPRMWGPLPEGWEAMTTEEQGAWKASLPLAGGEEEER